MSAILLSLAAFVSTLLGGLFALRFRRLLHYILSFSAGVVLGVVAFDILPELFALAHESNVDVSIGMVALVAGFLLFHAVERFILVHAAHEHGFAPHRHPTVGLTSAAALIGHSFMDGVGIGLGFQVSPSVGIAVAVAVIAHDFCDGLNTVSVMLLHGNEDPRSRLMLALDALAPIVGAASTLAFNVPPAVLVPYLGFFAGFLLFIATSDILPEAHTTDRALKFLALLALTVLGAGLTFVAVRVAG
ncbi:MAG: ZIP family metal transporter [Proteobacteria bacterium]|nr:ZIP family metal transporter [Pseudomonadota bacterium]